jgi:hypothetical protein
MSGWSIFSIRSTAAAIGIQFLNSIARGFPGGREIDGGEIL